MCFENDTIISKLENKVQEALKIATDSDKRFDEVYIRFIFIKILNNFLVLKKKTSRRLAIMELNLEGVEDRAETAETYKLNF